MYPIKVWVRVGDGAEWWLRKGKKGSEGVEQKKRKEEIGKGKKEKWKEEV
jgi:hypothetical protein